MSVAPHECALLEAAIYTAFPLHPIPPMTLDRTAALARQTYEPMAGRTWPEAVGCRLCDDEPGPFPSIWTEGTPLEITHYYLPSHLVFSSISLGLRAVSYIPGHTMQALILAPSDRLAPLSEIRAELRVEAPMVPSALAERAALYHRMTKEQRACIVLFLSLYLKSHRTNFSKRGAELYLQNRDIWEYSLLSS